MVFDQVPTADGARFGQAVVLGGRAAGVLAARVLASWYEQVIVIDRNTPAARASAITGQVLAPQGAAQLERLWPGILGEFAVDGATLVGGGSAKLPTVQATRPYFDNHLWRRISDLDNVTQLSNVDVVGLVAKGAHCVGVWVLPRNRSAAARTITADLVVDAMGPRSRLCCWLADLWHCSVPIEQSTITMRYLSRLYSPPRSAASLVAVRGTAGNGPYRSVIMAVEHGYHIATLCCHADHRLPLDDDQFDALICDQVAPEFAELIRCGQPTGRFSFLAPSFQRRRFDQTTRLPHGVIALGGSVHSTDPLRGQELTVAALHAGALERLLGELDLDPTGRSHLPSWYFTAIAHDLHGH